jgi:plasmid maintenance system killer protein
MKSEPTAAAVNDYTQAPWAVQKAFDKQLKLLIENFRHPSLRVKKYDESRDIWQARVNRNWRFYFAITGDTFLILNIIPHPN